MGVHDCVDVGPRTVGFRVDVIFERWTRCAFDKIAGEIDRHDVIGRQRTSH